MTSQQQFLHRRARAATEWFCRRCDNPPRQVGGLCDGCAVADERDASMQASSSESALRG